jgi:hypothetical protein
MTPSDREGGRAADRAGQEAAVNCIWVICERP